MDVQLLTARYILSCLDVILQCPSAGVYGVISNTTEGGGLVMSEADNVRILVKKDKEEIGVIPD